MAPMDTIDSPSTAYETLTTALLVGSGGLWWSFNILWNIYEGIIAILLAKRHLQRIYDVISSLF